jgi:hypothetical protein
MNSKFDKHRTKSNGQERPSGLAALHHDMAGDNQGNAQRIDDSQPLASAT